ncbi:transglutaminase family protein [Sulfurospirillum sp. 1612]|uniref:transglutaminase family protein n=1 Tax=Sulfurospirillum sp. 1612 TaxID=3094835 RepID=UPI002F94B902
MIYNIYHKTTFDYQGMVSFSHNIARLKPKDTPFQKRHSYAFEVNPAVYESREFIDIFGNTNTHILVREPHHSLSVTGISTVEVFEKQIEDNIAHLRENSITYDAAIKRLSAFHHEDIDAKRFLFESALISNSAKDIKNYARESFQNRKDLFEATEAFMGRIFNDFEFVSGFSDVMTPVEKIFKAKKGVCQDFAQLAIAALRSIGLPAKYISGYIETIPPEGQTKLFGVDASHAWFSVYIPGAGWADFDPTNNCIPKDQHIILGEGRDYHDIAPLKGIVFSSGSSRLSVVVDVRQKAHHDDPGEEPHIVMSQHQSQS